MFKSEPWKADVKQSWQNVTKWSMWNIMVFLTFENINNPKWQILDSSKLKEFADDNFIFNENESQFFNRVENTVGKGEIARYKQFFLFPQCFQKTRKKPGLVWERVKLSQFQSNCWWQTGVSKRIWSFFESFFAFSPFPQIFLQAFLLEIFKTWDWIIKSLKLEKIGRKLYARTLGELTL